MAANERPCETTVFDGQRLALNDAPATTESISAKPSEGKSSEAKLSAEKPSREAASPERSAAEKPAAAKPGSGRYSHRRSYYSAKRVAVEEPPQKPETSSGISSFFSSRTRPQ
jgi:hypothetical protein